MSTSIEWTQRPGTKGETWNPTTGCNKVSQGCKHCYAEGMHKRLRAMGQPKYQQAFNAGVVTHPDTLTLPLTWKKPRTVFVNSMSDLFHADVPFAFIDQVFHIMSMTGQHTYQILTKRPERMAEYFAERPKLKVENDNFPDVPAWAIDAACWHQWPLSNVWLGTSVEDQATANERIPHLLRCPATVRFLSCEPLLGRVEFREAMPIQLIQRTLKTSFVGAMRFLQERFWVITGGESGSGARPMHPDWARSLRDQCAAAGVPFFFKQWGAWLPAGQGEAKGIRASMVKDGHEWDLVGKHASGRLLDGVEHLAWPSVSTMSTTTHHHNV